MSDEPEGNRSYPTFLVDYLYVDVARVRSYLAQLAGGVATSATEARERASSRTGEASLPIARGGLSASTAERSETTRALGDLIFSTARTTSSRNEPLCSPVTELP